MIELLVPTHAPAYCVHPCVNGRADDVMTKSEFDLRMTYDDLGHLPCQLKWIDRNLWRVESGDCVVRIEFSAQFFIGPRTRRQGHIASEISPKASNGFSHETRMNRREVRAHFIDGVLATAVHDICRWYRSRERLNIDSEIAAQKGGEGQSPPHHCLGRLQRRVRCVHPAEVYLSLVGDSRPTQDSGVSLEQNDVKTSIG